ncbi:hypothetical protein INT45_013825 [Circinella minor]|uniref:Uncharacterized protein n=1 Tax=Circinella minor TaxID=1195481 RepID=A0A8H7RUE9_9FUNG|nr:hypothetical protein INT45_013825 [Circinella minor]
MTKFKSNIHDKRSSSTGSSKGRIESDYDIMECRQSSTKFSKMLQKQFPKNKNKVTRSHDQESESENEISEQSISDEELQRNPRRSTNKRSYEDESDINSSRSQVKSQQKTGGAHKNKKLKYSKDSNSYGDPITIRKKTDHYQEFIDAVKQACYRIDAFPTRPDASLMTRRIVLDVKGFPPDDSREVDEDLVDDFMDIISKKRTSLHSAVGDWLSTKSFPLNRFPAECSTGANQKGHLYAYLLKDNRFARFDYDSRGRFLFNECISDCIRYTLLNQGRNKSRLSPVPPIIPREAICLVAQMICYRLKLEAFKQNEYPSTSSLQTMSSGEAHIEKFGWDTTWENAYHDMLNKDGDLGQHIQWLEVEKYVTKTILKMN